MGKCETACIHISPKYFVKEYFMAARHTLTGMLDHSLFDHEEGQLICSRCKEELPKEYFNKDSSKTRGYSYICKSCKNILRENYRKPTKEEIKENNRKNYERNKHKRLAATRKWLSTIEGRAMAMVSNSKYHSPSRGLEHDIVYEDVLELFHKQEMKCALTKIDFDMNSGKGNPFSPSIDRIDSSRGYHKDNIRLVCYAVNIGLSNFGTDTYVYICKAVAENN